jgi:HPt (histidine-containing phosphotransfer) domain-containing protein
MLSGRTETSGARTTENCSEVFDQIKALELTEGDEELLRDLIMIFKQESAELMGQMESAVTSGDCDSVRKVAHRLKGASASVGGTKIAATARILETMGATKTLIDADAMVARLQELILEYQRATDSFGRESK